MKKRRNQQKQNLFKFVKPNDQRRKQNFFKPKRKKKCEIKLTRSEIKERLGSDKQPCGYLVSESGPFCKRELLEIEFWFGQPESERTHKNQSKMSHNFTTRILPTLSQSEKSANNIFIIRNCMEIQKNSSDRRKM